MKLVALRPIIVNPSNKHTATLFFFHGSGSSGRDTEVWTRSLTNHRLTFPHVKIIYPTAPAQPYTPLGGMLSNVWFDRSAVAITAPEQMSSVDSICQSVSSWIEDEVRNGIPVSRIAIGGFSMGGALALHVAYRFKKSLAGCFVMSSFLNDHSVVYEALKSNTDMSTPPLLQFHGTVDTMVPLKWGSQTHDTLKSLGVNGEFITLKGVDHSLVRVEVELLKDWVSKVMPVT